ncbi:hypothetical protein C8R44DRAFT_892360 [Mycena epipterygia]|nr:hypothetical protein C8R44DRAFT_892360 [Mycena epipterygia]
MGDLNARIAALKASERNPPRTPIDKGNSTSLGRWLCKVFEDYDIVFVSGADCFGPDSGKYTSSQGKTLEAMCRTVIDYAACSHSLFPRVNSFTVADQVPGYDHAAITLRLKVNLDEQNAMFASPRKKCKVDIRLPDETALDRLLIATLAAGKDEEKKLLTLYGPVLAVTEPIKVTIHGLCMNAGKITASAEDGDCRRVPGQSYWQRYS